MLITVPARQLLAAAQKATLGFTKLHLIHDRYSSALHMLDSGGAVVAREAASRQGLLKPLPLSAHNPPVTYDDDLRAAPAD